MNALLTESELLSSPIEEGDAGVILKPNGSFKVFSTGPIDASNLTSEQRAQGEKLMALSVALQVPQVMEMLLQLANDPEVFGKGVSLASRN